MMKDVPNCTRKSQTPGPPLSRRKFLHLMGMATTGVALNACASFQSKSTPQNGDKVQLVYQDWRTDWFPSMAQQSLEKFHATHPNTQVFYTPDPDDIEETMVADMQAGTAPDVFQGCCSYFPIWAQQGHLLDLRPYVEADLDQATIDDWDRAQYDAFFTKDGQQYGLPKYHGALALYYNKDLFDNSLTLNRGFYAIFWSQFLKTSFKHL